MCIPEILDSSPGGSLDGCMAIISSFGIDGDLELETEGLHDPFESWMRCQNRFQKPKTRVSTT